jgi:hypothetical protein
MSMDSVFAQFSKASPLPVMARIAIEHATGDEFLDRLFAENADRQVQGDLLFSTVVKLMTVVACRVRPSVNAAYQKQGPGIGVSIQSVYAKLRKIEPQVMRALVRETAARLKGVAGQLNADLDAPFPGYENRVLDGAHLAAVEHRIGELRKIAAGPLPGLGLCVLDPVRQMIVDFVPCEDGHAQERSLLEAIIDDLEPGQVWIADRNFCVAVLLWEIQNNQSFFVVREHAQNVKWTSTGAEQPCTPTETGGVFEQPIEIHDDFGNRFPARRIRVLLDKSTRDGDRDVDPDQPSRFHHSRAGRRGISPKMDGRNGLRSRAEVPGGGDQRTRLSGCGTVLVRRGPVCLQRAEPAACRDVGRAWRSKDRTIVLDASHGRRDSCDVAWHDAAADRRILATSLPRPGRRRSGQGTEATGQARRPRPIQKGNPHYPKPAA